MSSRVNNSRAAVRWPILAGVVVTAGIVAAAALAFANTGREATTASADPADSLIGLWIDSVGGMETYEAFQSATFTVTTVLYDTLSGRVKRSRPRYVWIKKGPHGEETRVERWEPIGFIEQAFNGEIAWARLDGELLPDTAKDWQEALYVARDLFYWVGLPFKLRDPGVFLSYRGMTSRAGLEFRPDPTSPPTTPPENGYHAVSVSFGEGVGEHQDVFTYYFEPGRGYPTEVNYVEQGKTNINRMIWGTTRQSGAIAYPYVVRRDHITESGKRTKALVLSGFVANPQIPQARFEHP
jgi:hypothetical protein